MKNTGSHNFEENKLWSENISECNTGRETNFRPTMWSVEAGVWNITCQLLGKTHRELNFIKNTRGKKVLQIT